MQIALLSEFRTADGSDNNAEFNVAGSGESRIAPANFAPGTADTPIDGTNPRVISNTVSSGDQAENHDPTGLSAWMYVWGQFVDHDIDHSNSDETNRIDITIPKGDPDFTDGGTIPMTRFVLNQTTGTADNDITGWIDGSQVYGSDNAKAASLRTADGHLLISDGNNLPIKDGAFFGGDVRAAENPDLTAVNTLFVREHNFQVDRLQVAHPEWSGDQRYQMARAIVTAEIANITYMEFLPHLVGPDAIQPYHGFDPSVDPRITQEFATAAFRFGHSIVSGTETKIDNDGETIGTPQSLADAFTNTPAQVQADGGIDGLIRGIMGDPTQANDVFAVNELRNLLIAPPAFIDLIAIDIQRERDLGVGTLKQTREALGLTPYTGFNQITSDPAIAANLENAFGSVDNVSLFIGGLAEDHAPGSMLGPTFQIIVAQQFQNLRDGDRLWWENQGFDDTTNAQIKHTTLSDIIQRNTDTPYVQNDAFVAASRHTSGTLPKDAGVNELVIGVNDDNAVISGGVGDDTIVAGLGQNQTLIGGGGSDVFIISGKDQVVTITDFMADVDKLELQMSAADFSMQNKNGHAVIRYGGNAISLSTVTIDQLNTSNLLLPTDHQMV
jgi:peroxidase